MSVIPNAIPKQAYELVRDRIANILAEELFTQSQINYDDNLLPKSVYLERIAPINLSEMPAVNVTFQDGDYLSDDQLQSNGLYTYNIDCYFSAKTDVATRGDERAAVLLQRMVGVMRAILMNPRYNTLGFEKPFIENRTISSIKIGNPINTQDAANTVLARIELKVRVPENVKPVDVSIMQGFDTSVQLGVTDLGYVFGGGGVQPPDDPCDPVSVLINSASLANPASGSTLDVTVIDTLGNLVGVLSGGNTVTVPAQVCVPSGVDLQGNSLVDIPSGQTKTIVIEFENGDPLTISTVTDSANSYEGTIENKVSTNSTTSGQEQTYDPLNLGDEGARYLAGDFASVVYAEVVDQFTLLNDNDFGNKQNYTGDTGGYLDFSDPTPGGAFYDKDGVPTTKALAFPNNIIRCWSYRRRMFLMRSGARSWQASLDAIQGETKGGETGWFLPTTDEYRMFSNNNLTNNSSTDFIDGRLFNWPSFTMWTGSTNKKNTTQAYRYNSGLDIMVTASKTQANGNAFVKLF